MAEQSQHDAWTAGESYDAYMGRWSRLIAPRFLDWLDVPAHLDWLEIGCGTGALASEIAARCGPKSLAAIDPSEAFVASARARLDDARWVFQVGDAQALPFDAASRDVIVSGLVLNFVPDKLRVLAEMKRVARPGGVIGFYVWDYPGGGVEFMHAFWKAAAALDASAQVLSEDRRFPDCSLPALIALMQEAGHRNVMSKAIEVPTVFRDFDDYWRPFTLGVGPAPGYCVSLDGDMRERLKQSLKAQLPCREDGSIHLTARAWALKAVV